MPLDEHDLRKIVRNHVELVNAECERLAALLAKLPHGDERRVELRKTHESLSNIVGIIKADLMDLS